MGRGSVRHQPRASSPTSWRSAAAALLLLAAFALADASQLDEDLTFDEEAVGVARIRREAEVAPVAPPYQEVPSAKATLTKRQSGWGFWGSSSDDEDDDVGSAIEGSGVEKVIYRVKFQVNLTWRVEYSNKQGTYFRDLATEIRNAFEIILRPVSGDKTLFVSNMKRTPTNYVEVTMDINYEGFGDQSGALERRIREALGTSRLGSIPVNTQFFRFEDHGSAVTSPTACPPGKWRCSSGRCVGRCDGRDDCLDKSDEQDCITSSSSSITGSKARPTCRSDDQGPRTCDDGTTYACFCDGVRECPRGEDEAGCASSGCRQDQFSCDDDTQCIESSQVCDGVQDCFDNTDEDPAKCFVTPARPTCRSDDQGPRTCDDGTTYACFCDGVRECPRGEDEAECGASVLPTTTTSTTTTTTTTTSTTTTTPVPSTTTPPTTTTTSTTTTRAPLLTCPQGQQQLIRCTDGVTFACQCDGIEQCPDGGDEASLICDCPSTMFSCDQGSVCIDLSKTCDNRADCYDGTDELGCATVVPCRSDEFTCKDGSCVASFRRCDYIQDCPDGEDESFCPCEPPNFECISGMCITPEKRCDGVKHCDDGSDEEVNCPCSEGEFSCLNGQCVAENLRCDGEHDCDDQSDEVNCSECSEDAYLCGDKHCIPKENVCDGVTDCDTDELECCEGSGSFECESDGTCLGSDKMCNGIKDCPNGEDEKGCPGEMCQPGEYRCKNGDCIPISQRCDGLAQCRDQSDESGCPCDSTQWTCGDGTCIPQEGRCNGRYECRDYSDEEQCPECSPGEWTCRSGDCIPASQRCDRVPHCRDGSDEENCLPPPACGYLEWTCRDGTCIPQQGRCDGRYDCPDYTDEEGCQRACTSGEWRCSDGTCIPLQARCDGRYNCPDYTDEEGCSPACGNGEWTCEDRTCIPQQARCDGRYDCPDYTDENGCQSGCSPGEWTCRNGDCIPDYQRCDRTPQCLDRSDEENCRPEPACGSEEWTCRIGTCIPVQAVCDGRYDCPDYTDEEGCPVDKSCSPSEWTCRNGDCIPDYQRCDRTPQCLDRSDEENCRPEPACGSGEWTCRDGTCIPEQARCDGLYDCPDYTDEDSCQACNSVTEWQCDDAECIDRRLRCDGKRDCPYDNSDERDCPYTCRPDQFRCENGECLDASQRCNGREECNRGEDERGCACGPNEFTCVSSGLCISEYGRCDGRPDCRDGSDEQGCETLCHPVEEWQCANGQCIPSRYRCDGRQDCADNSDELDASCVLTSAPDTNSCPPQQFACKNGECVDRVYLCDGIPDCGDGSDERDCIPTEDDIVCGTNQFLCNSGECISSSKVCDKKKDCNDNSDELPCDFADNRQCTADEFRCKDGGCIEKEWRCDNVPDCADASDEIDCCSTSEFQCGDGFCIPDFKKCDGTYDCIDGSDERAECECRTNEFQCKDGACISSTGKCNGYAECLDGSDEQDCGFAQGCTSNEFVCDSGDCVSTGVVCDGIVDCNDGSDEADCTGTARTCASYEFTCGDGTCIYDSAKCDGRYDCADGSDELECFPNRSCEDYEFTCGDGTCVSVTVRCDGQEDCRDGSDELNCRPRPPPRCQANEFQCRGGRCIPDYARCDGKRDCRDGSDETSCITTTTTTTQPPFIPSANLFQCADGNYINDYLRCDGRRDCNDGSDEVQCAGTDTVNLRTYPSEQTIQQSREVVFQCRDEGPIRAPVRWSREGNRAMPVGTTDNMGRLTMPNIQIEHQGTYYCEAQGVSPSMPGRRKPVYLQVIPYVAPTLPPVVVCSVIEATCMNGQCIDKDKVCDGVYDCDDASDEMRCNPLGCEPNEYQCDNKRCVLKTWLCDSDDDCGDGSDERECVTNAPGSACRYNEFTCLNGSQCIPKSFHCDGEVDCLDGSDEQRCTKPIVVEPPPRNIMVQVGETFTITCRVIGVPTPTVIWRLNWGHVPDKCQMTSVDGQGALTCPGVQPTDQGAYSCEAINSLGSVFAQPDCIVQVKGSSPQCQPPLFNAGAVTAEECLTCFCFGATEQCYSTDRYITQLPPPANDSYQLIGVNQDQFKGNYIVRTKQYQQSSRFLSPQSSNAVQLNVDRSKLEGPSDLIVYFSLPDSHKGQQLTSYGGYLRYKIKYSSTVASQTIKGPDVIMVGNDITLMHVHDGDFKPDFENQVDVRFEIGQWFKRVVGRGQIVQSQEPANREEIMMVLENIELLLIRALYTDAYYVVSTLSEVQMDTAVIHDNTQGRAVLVEECRCPTGYVGLSCQDCAPNYKRVSDGPWLGRCVPDVECRPGEYGDPANGIPCLPCPCPLTTPTNQFSSTCFLDSDGQVTCNCLQGYQGRRCEVCASGYEGNPNVPGDSCRPETVCMTTFTCPDGTVHPWSRRCDGIKDCFNYEDERECDVCFNSGHKCSDRHCIHFERICDGHQDCYDGSDEFPENCLDYLPCDHISKWTCDDRTCIDRRDHCNGVFDCPDGSDELYCNCSCTSPNQFKCQDGTCLSARVRCNGQADCKDGSDEWGCCNEATEHACGDGTCIDRRRVCDGQYDCSDYSDEPSYCARNCDPNTMHQCGDGTCIDRRRVCDGQYDCSDYSDEPSYCREICDPNKMHQCGDGTCIDRRRVCDGQYDCTDYSDEPSTCQTYCDDQYEFTCRNGDCIDRRRYCDGYSDCRDGSDEYNCPQKCSEYEFQCGDGTCIDQRQLCDGRADCRDSSDESQQAGCCVGPYYFQCRNGDCIDASLVCDYRENCYDGSDEYGCSVDCNPSGSYSVQADPVTGLCQCKELVTGPKCDRCQPNTFFLNDKTRFGCIDCFCMGITKACTSSNWYRQQESVSFTNDRQGFELVDKFQEVVISNDIYVDSGQQEIVFSEFSRLGQEVYYWNLPQRFLGDKLSSYGGNLTYSLRYVPAPGGQSSANSAAAVEIFGNDITLRHFTNGQLSRSLQATVTVPLYEDEWERQDGQKANREHFLMVLADLEYIHIKATYTTNTQEVALKEVIMDHAEPRNTGQERAFAVEFCECPPGYKGLSCEDCDVGYTRRLSGVYLGECVPCECNGHSEECDPDTSVCSNCRDNTSGDFCELCAPGFVMNRLGRCEREENGYACNCDPRGSLTESCQYGICQCKANVRGEYCDACEAGYFDLSEENPDGCLKCWCSGATSQCFSSNYYRTQLPMQLLTDHGFTLSNRLRSNVIREGFGLNLANNEISFDNFDELSGVESYYWSLPQMFTGNRLASYGGNLTITQRYIAFPGSNTYADPDVIIRSAGGLEFIWMISRSLPQNALQTYTVPLIETSFTMNQQPASRSEFLKALSSIEAILVRATPSNRMRATFLRDVIMDTAVPSNTGQPRAVKVEQCQCPPEYSGLSCEQCRPGYYRDIFTNTCEPCRCNGHEESCTQLPSGEVRCKCLPGYYGNNCEGSGIPTPSVDDGSVSLTVTTPTIQVAAVGSTIQMHCQARSLKGPQNRVSVTWNRANGELPYGRAQDNRQGLLVISEVQVSDSGTYICTASDGFHIVTKTTTLEVGGGSTGVPRVTIEERREILELRRGQTLEVRCSAQGSPRPQVVWSHGPNRERLPFNVQQQNGVLIFRNADVTSSGEYYCTATNSEGTNYARIIINVIESGSQTLPERVPVIIVQVSEQEVEVNAGETVRVSCSSPSPGQLRIKWSRLGGTLPSQSSERDGLLSIPNARAVDSGIYVCRISDERSSFFEESSTRITISETWNMPTVQIQPDRQTVNQGSEAELTCIVTGSPPPEIKWSKVNDEFGVGVQIEGNVLRIVNAVVSDRGMYVCTAENAGGVAQTAAIVEVERREPPEVQIYPQVKQTIVAGANALFQCHLIGGIPTPTVRWARTDGRPLSLNTEILNGGVLRFNQVLGDEEGSYTCTAENDAGKVTAVAVLEIQSLPVITIRPGPSPYTLRVGERMRLECSARGEPSPSVTWQKLEVNFPTTVPSQSTAPNVAIYEVPSASKSDSGTYQCSANNAAGLSEERIQIIVEDVLPAFKPGGDTTIPVTPEAATIFVPIGGNYEFSCLNQGPDASSTIYDFRRSDNRPLPRGYRIENGVLYLTNVDQSASGEYACVGSDRISGRILFTIYATFEVIAPPRITLDPARQIVRPGDLVRIRCTATGPQPITINWSKEGGYMPRTVIINGGEMMFRGIETSDAGRYICQAVNNAGTARAVAEVVVNEEPLLTAIQQDIVRFVGQTAELRCEASGIDPNAVSWSRLRGSLPSNAVTRGNLLRLTSLRPEDSGQYQCQVSGPTGFLSSVITLNVMTGRQTMDIRIIPSRSNVRIGDDIDLTCEVSGQAPASVTWRRINSRLPLNAQPRENVLRLINVQANYGGIYQCVVTTSTGVFEENFPLAIQGVISAERVDFEQNQRSVMTRSVAFGLGVVMECNVNLTPPVSYTWSKQGGELPVNSLVENNILNIPEVHTEDAGLFVCTASNTERSLDQATLLVVTGVIPRFAENSYLSLPTLPRAYLAFDIEISFKPESGDGLILYNSQRESQEDGDFVSFGLSAGYAEFRFDVGSGPAIIKSRQPLALNKWHTVKLSRDRKKGSMIVDDGEPIMGSSVGRFLGLDLVRPLYLGGVPDFDRIHQEAGFTTGYSGCIARLVIRNSLTIDLMRDSKTKIGIRPCETCIGNPCQNNGVCQEAYTEVGHKCICPAGFSGGLCENTGEACYPGVCGTGRCVNKPGGFECFCPFGKFGQRCERDIMIQEPAFGDGSYIAYQTPRALKRFSVDLNFKPESLDDGLLMYCSQKYRGEGDFASLAIRNKRLEFRFNTGSGTATLQSEPLFQDEWVEVRANRTDRRGSMTINGGQMQNTESPGSNRGLNLITPLYIGGVDNTRVEISPEVGVEHGFKGCVKEIKIMDQQVRMAESLVDSANVGQCGGATIAFCSTNPCLNNGQCSEDPGSPHGYSCSCQEGYSGHNCEMEPGVCTIIRPCKNGASCVGSRNEYSCNCPLGFAGQHCEHNVDIRESASFSGDSWVEFDKLMLPQEDGLAQKVTFEFSTIKPDGLLFWYGQEPTVSGRGQDYISVAIKDGIIEFTFDVGTGPAMVRSPIRVDDGERHSLTIERTGRQGLLELDSSVREYGQSPGILHMLNAEGNIYIGGVPDLALMTDGVYTTGFQGCIHRLSIGEEQLINFMDRALSGVNVKTCPSFGGGRHSTEGRNSANSGGWSSGSSSSWSSSSSSSWSSGGSHGGRSEGWISAGSPNQGSSRVYNTYEKNQYTRPAYNRRTYKRTEQTTRKVYN